MGGRDEFLDRVTRILAPGSVAIAGASADENKHGYTALERLVESEYDGDVYPVNPGHEGTILGRPVFPTVSSISGVIDLVYIVTPVAAVPEVLADAGRANAAGAVIFSAGFREAGNAAAEEELVRIASQHGIRFIGPNVMGLVNVPADLYLGIDVTYPPGGISVISQSGNIGMSIGTMASREAKTGMSHFVSIGNEADLRFDELLPYFRSDEDTEILVLYVEGMTDGRSFLEAASRFTDTKPIIALKGGRTKPGKSSARSHTASLAGDAAVLDDVYAQAGITTVTDIDTVVPVAQALTGLPALDGRNVAVMTEAGGLATVASDTLVEHGLAVPELADDTKVKLRELFPHSPNVSNPVDTMVTLDTASLHGEAAETILADPTVDGLLICGEYGGYGLDDPDTPDLPADETTAVAQRESARRIARLPAEYGKPIVIQSTYEPAQSKALWICREHGIPVYETLRYGAVAFQALAEYAEYRAVSDRRSDFVLRAADGRHERLNQAVEDGEHLSEVDARAVLADYNVPVVPGRLVTSPEEAAEATDEVGGEVAMKVVSPELPHKTEVGGVSLGVSGGPAARDIFRQLRSNVKAAAPSAPVDGVLVSPMVEDGIEVIIGGVRDEEVGPVVMLGLGGIFVEELGDVAFGAVPLTEYDARQLIENVQGKSALRGARGQPAIDEDALIAVLLNVSRLMAENPRITTLDLNPVICLEDGATVVDASIEVSGESTA